MSESDYGQDRCWKVPVYVCMFEWIEYSWITLLVNTMFSVVSYSFENIGIYDYRYHASQKCTLITKHSIDHDTPITVNSVKYYWHSSLEAWITETQVSCTRHPESVMVDPWLITWSDKVACISCKILSLPLPPPPPYFVRWLHDCSSVFQSKFGHWVWAGVVWVRPIGLAFEGHCFPCKQTRLDEILCVELQECELLFERKQRNGA